MSESLNRHRCARRIAAGIIEACARIGVTTPPSVSAGLMSEAAWKAADNGRVHGKDTRDLVIEMLRDREAEQSRELVELVRARAALLGGDELTRSIQAERIGALLAGRVGECSHPLEAATFDGEWDADVFPVPSGAATCGLCGSTLTIPMRRRGGPLADIDDSCGARGRDVPCHDTSGSEAHVIPSRSVAGTLSAPVRSW